MKNLKLLLIKKYSKDFDLLMKKAMETAKCTKEECKELSEIFEKKKTKYFDNIMTIFKEQQKTALFINYDKNRSELVTEFQKNDITIEYRKLLLSNKKMPTELKSKYDKIHKQYLKDIQKLLKNYRNNNESKIFQKKTKQLTKEFHNSKEANDLQKCSFEKCNSIHKEGVKLVKTFAEKLCKEDEKKFCKVYNMLKKIDIDTITYKQNKIAINILKN
jgi:hypothetical protein